MRSFIRNPTDIAIEIRLDQSCQHEPLRNVSRGGLCFLHPQAAPVGSNIVVRIALTAPPFEAACRVTWCQADGNAWQVGVEFLDQDIHFRLRMVEQICYIEQYRRTVRESQGRALSSQEAAIEWIERYAETFPFPETNADSPPDKKWQSVILRWLYDADRSEIGPFEVEKSQRRYTVHGMSRAVCR